MHIVFCHDVFYSSKRNGTVYSYGAFPYEFWQKRFLPHFDSMTIIGRKKKLHPEETGVLPISSGDNVNHILIPDLKNPAKRLSKHKLIYNRICEQINRADALVVHGSVDLGVIATNAARAKGIPYAIEMDSHAFDGEYDKALWLNQIFSSIKEKKAKDMVYHADAVVYATEKRLQKIYPTQGLVNFSPNVEIPMPAKGTLKNRVEKIASGASSINIGIVGSFECGLMGLNVAIEALGKVEKRRAEFSSEDDCFPDFRLKVLGQTTSSLWSGMIDNHGLTDKVDFCGAISTEEKRLQWLDGIDVYLHTRHQENLPRILLGAMSRGCSALSSYAAGAQELLSLDFFHENGNSEELAQHIWGLGSSEKRIECAKVNFEKAKSYTHEVLASSRNEFWQRFVEKAEKSAA